MSTIFGDFVNGLFYFSLVFLLHTSTTFAFLCDPIHNSIIISSKGTSMALSSVRYFRSVRWSEAGMESMTGCEWAAD